MAAASDGNDGSARSSRSSSPSTLIAAVGHRFCRDLSAGPVWLDRLATLAWPPGVVVDDFSFGALAMVQRLQAEPYGRALFLTAEVRDQPPGTLRVRRHERVERDPARVQASITEAGAGVVAIDLLLTIGDHHAALPPETWIVEVEPVDRDWGERLSPQVGALYARVLPLVRRFAAGHAPHDDGPREARAESRDVMP